MKDEYFAFHPGTPALPAVLMHLPMKSTYPSLAFDPELNSCLCTQVAQFFERCPGSSSGAIKIMLIFAIDRKSLQDFKNR
jgi:hypothetical protein